MSWRRTTCLGLALAGCLADRHPVDREPDDSPDARAPSVPLDAGVVAPADGAAPPRDARSAGDVTDLVDLLDGAPRAPDAALFTDAFLPFPDLAPLPDAALRIQRSLTMLTQRRFLALTEVDPAALDRPAVSPRRFADVTRLALLEGSRYWRRGQGPSGSAAILPDGSLALAEPSDCHEGILLRKFDGERIVHLGRHSTGTCGTGDSSGVRYSEDGRWALFSAGSALRLDGSELSTEPPECAGRAHFGTRFVAWDGQDTALAANESCLQQVDLPTGDATEIPLPAEDCAAVPDTAHAAARAGGRLLLSCPGTLAAVDADGGVEWIAGGWHAIEGRPAVKTPVGAVILVADRGEGHTAAVTAGPNGTLVLPVTTLPANTLLVADALSGAPHLVTAEPVPPDAAAPGADTLLRITAVNPDGTATPRSSALVASGVFRSAVLGDAASGPAFVSIEAASGETVRIHVLRGRGERIAAETLDLAVSFGDRLPTLRPWPGQPALAVLASNLLSIVDARTDHARLAPIGDPLAYVLEPDHLRMFSFEAEAQVATLGSDAPLVIGPPVTGNAARLGETPTEAVVVHDAPHVGFGAPARVDFVPAGETLPARTADLAGEVLGVVGDWVVARNGDAFEAVNRDTLRRATVEPGEAPVVEVWPTPEAGATLFTFDRAGTLRRIDFTDDAPRVRVVATGIPGAPYRARWLERHGLLFDRRSGDVLLSVSSEGPGGQLHRFSGAPEAPLEAPRPVLASDRSSLAIVLAPGGGRALAWEDTSTGTAVWLVCLGAAHCPRPRRLAVVPAAADRSLPEFQLTPNGRLLVDSEGVTRDVESGGPAVIPRCGAGDCSRPVQPYHPSGQAFGFSPDGRRMQIWPETAFLPGEGQIVGLTGVFQRPDGGGEPGRYTDWVSALTPGGAIAALSRDGDIAFRRFDAALDLLDVTPVATADGLWSRRLHGQLLGSAGDFAVWKVNTEAPQVTTQVVIAEVQPGGAITAPVFIDAEVLEVW